MHEIHAVLAKFTKKNERAQVHIHFLVNEFTCNLK